MLRFVLERSNTNRQFGRREFLQIAGLEAIAAGSARKPASAEGPTQSPGSTVSVGVRRAKSVIVVFASGGQSQLDMWDPKPQAPREIRGDFSHISTSVPGTIVCEHLPRLAALADRYTLVRTMSHADHDHGSAVYLSLTGQYHAHISSNPAVKPTDLPSLMSVFKRVRREAPATSQNSGIDEAVEV